MTPVPRRHIGITTKDQVCRLALASPTSKFHDVCLYRTQVSILLLNAKHYPTFERRQRVWLVSGSAFTERHHLDAMLLRCSALPQNLIDSSMQEFLHTTNGRRPGTILGLAASSCFLTFGALYGAPWWWHPPVLFAVVAHGLCGAVQSAIRDAPRSQPTLGVLWLVDANCPARRADKRQHHRVVRRPTDGNCQFEGRHQLCDPLGLLAAEEGAERCAETFRHNARLSGAGEMQDWSRNVGNAPISGHGQRRACSIWHQTLLARREGAEMAGLWLSRRSTRSRSTLPVQCASGEMSAVGGRAIVPTP